MVFTLSLLLCFNVFVAVCSKPLNTFFEDDDIDEEGESRLIDGLNDEDSEKGIGYVLNKNFSISLLSDVNYYQQFNVLV